MTLSDHMSLAEVKNRLSEVVERLEKNHGRVVITKHGHPSAVMLTVEDLESLEETLEILSNPELLKSIREAEEDIDSGRSKSMTKAEALASIERREAG